MHKLARYRVIDRLGAGAAGGVYLVEDRLLGGSPLALKRVEHASDPAMRSSFAREFAVLASLSIPGVARVRDLGVMVGEEQIAAGPFFTRDYVPGEALSDWAVGRSTGELLAMFLRVASIVGQLHRRAVVHGDLKPANVIVDAAGQPHLIDFGLSSRGSDVLHGSGTPLFMAPELLSGGSSSMSADVYALGATLWAVLTGAAPLQGLGERALGAKLRGELPSLDGYDGELRKVLEAAHWALLPTAERAPSVDELAAKVERASGVSSASPRDEAAFVTPRPRGRDRVLDALAQYARDARDGAAVGVLYGSRGMGKSTLLRELKWRLQLEAVHVLEVRCREGLLSPTAQLARQLGVAHPSADEGVIVDGGCAQQEANRVLVEALAEALRSDDREAYVLLIDDLDHDGTLLAEALRGAAHGATGRGPLVIASSESIAAPGLAALVDVEPFALEPLSDPDARALVTDALGPVDEATADALRAHASGNPGLLIEALAWLSRRGDLTADSLTQLSAGDIGARVAADRVAQLSASALDVLTLLALAGRALSEALLRRQSDAPYEAVRAELLAAGLVRDEHQTLIASEPLVNDWLRRGGDRERAQHIAARALACDGECAMDPVARVELALVAGDRERARASIHAALLSLSARGATQYALRLCEACAAAGLDDTELALRATELYIEHGDCTSAAEHAEQLLALGQLDSVQAARARVAGARAHVAGARFDRAIELLSAVDAGAPPRLLAQAARELARVHLRRGEYEAALAAVQRGLAVASDLPASAELLAIDATLSSQQGEHALAKLRFEQALALARKLSALREEALVLGYRALSHERTGALVEARTDYDAGLQAARHAGDLGLTATYAVNLGNVCYRLGELERVEEHYTLAARLSRRSGRTTTALVADNNLANLHVHLGSFARARVLAEASLSEAERLGVEHSAAHALTILADVDVRTGELESALSRYEAAAARFTQIGRTHDVVEAWLDVAEALLDRGGVSDISAASARLATARALLERHGHEDLRIRLRLLIARARAGNGDVDGAVKELGEVERSLHVERDREILWQVLAAEATLHAQLGAGLLAGRKTREAAELIELLATQAPREAREAFRADPRRRAVLAAAKESLSSRQAERPLSVTSADSPRFGRLLELIKRLARERDLDRLLERITDAAVDLSGAERGFVLLVDGTGQLAPHTVRASGGAETDPHVAFSRSIAEAVLIDGEPIVTVNARDDRRLNEFMSVHKLMLKSVACIPISGPTGVLGVLYLEHRLRAGRFQDDDVDLLMAFADQAAIALENARLWSENERRREAIESKARELAQANAEIERLLEARTEELEEVRRDLGRARAQLEGQSRRHGIVGQSAVMRRVFSLIDRVADSPVPIIIEGESGTGKELVARAIHAAGARKKEPFIALNCAALPEQLLESELFGHVRGAFTGADRDKRGLFTQAHGGTIFLDEFADMPARMQIDLLRVLQERRVRPVGADADQPIDVRVIAATNRPLKQLVASGRLREDLYYRMSVVEIRLPALRERTDDIPLLCDHFLSRLAPREGGRAPKLSRAGLERIMANELPGNVRQLEHLLTSAAMLSDGPLIQPEDLALEGGDDLVEPTPATRSQPPEATSDGEALPDDLQGYKIREKRRIIDALEKHGWNRAKAAHALGMPRRTFYRRLSEFEIL
jgi:transcriptional regulator with GAF, ATPase, and Fis domain